MKPRGHRWDWLEHIRDHVRDGTLDSHANLVAHILAVHYINGGGEAWPSQAELADSTGLGQRTVRRALHDLEQQSLLKTRQGPPAHARGNIYTLLLPAPQAASYRHHRPLATGTTGR